MEVQLFSAQTIRHTLQQVGLHGRRLRRNSLLKLALKTALKQFVEDNLVKNINYWNHVLWSDESKVNLFGSDGIQHVWRRLGEEYQENCALPTVNGGGSIKVWGCNDYCWYWGAAVYWGKLPSILDYNIYSDILKQKMMHSLQKLFSNITTTPNTPSRWQLPCSGQVCLQTWTLLSTCGASSSGRWRSTICLTSSSCVMSLWRSGRGCQQHPVQLWWIPCPGGLRQC